MLITAQPGQCPNCHLRRDLCLCSSAPQLPAELNVLLLTHSTEPAKASNSGRLLLNSLPNCSVAIWQRRSSGPWLMQQARTRQLQPLLVFPPSPGAEGNAPASMNVPNPGANVSRYWFVFIDATWQQARKIVRQTPQLHKLPRLQLTPPLQSRYGLRRGQQPGQVATAEAGALLLRELGYPAAAQQLEQYFQRFLAHFEAHRSNHPCTV